MLIKWIKCHKHVLKTPRLHSALLSPPRVAFRNPKTIRDKLVRSKLKEFIYKDVGTNICGRSNCDICKILESGADCVVYLLTCKLCLNPLFHNVEKWPNIL